jgi:imidazolonepropionase-like amidohydrolase
MKTVFRNGTIIDGLGNVIENGWVLIDGGKIVALGSDDESSENEHESRSVEESIDLSGKTMLPGLIDCHVHITHDGSPNPLRSVADEADPVTTLKTAKHARETLESGITTVRDMGGKRFIELYVRDAVVSGLVTGPRMICAGRMICMTGGHGCQIGMQADGPDELRKAARMQLQAGVDWLKFMATGGILTTGVEPGASQLTLEELKAGIEEAHKAGRKTAAHAQGNQGIKNAVLAGIDSVEHGMVLDNQIIEAMIERNVFLVPTLSVVFHILKEGREEGIPQVFVDKAQRMRDVHLRSLELAKQAGVKIAMGTDAGTPFNFHGQNATELTYLVDNGFTPGEAVMCATSKAAELLDLGDAIGSITPGKTADLLIVDDDPLEDVSILSNRTRIWAVYKGGVRVSGDGG